MRFNFVVAPLLALLSSVTWAAPPPGPGHPLILGVHPIEAQTGQQVRILGIYIWRVANQQMKFSL